MRIFSADFLAAFFFETFFFEDVFIDFFVDFLADFFDDFFFAATTFFLLFLAFALLAFLDFLAIVVLLLPPINSSWPGAARRPIEKFNRVNNRDRRSAGNLNHAPDIARGDHVRLDACDIGDLPVAQSVRNVRLENVVCPRRTATQMTLRYIFHHESILGKQIFRKLRDFLSVLK